MNYFFRRLFALILCLTPMAVQARDAKQQARIEHLISSVEALNGAVFIRNGSEFDTKAAGEHLRMKLKKAGDKVQTAENFIDGIASKSSISGKPYQIRKPDGSVTETHTFFNAQLQAYDKAHP